MICFICSEMYLQAIVKFSGKYYKRVNGTGHNCKNCLYFRTVMHKDRKRNKKSEEILRGGHT